MNIDEIIKSLKKYERQPIKILNVTPVDDYLMDYMRWGLMNPGNYDFNFKYLPAPKPKRKLFYKFVRRLKKLAIKN
jgi:hypothetical protein